MKTGRTRRTLVISAGAAFAAGAMAGSRVVHAQGPTPLKVSSFPGLSASPMIAAQQQNLFAKYGLSVELSLTPNSTSQREALAKGDLQIGHTAADNVVAMVEVAHADAVIVAGGDNGLNRIIVQPGINSLADLRGKTVVVDAPDTAYALLLYKALQQAGLNKGDYNIYSAGGTTQRLAVMKNDPTHGMAAVINVPFNFAAEAAGMKDIGSAIKSIGAYQANCVAVMHPWAKANSDTLVRYLKALIEARRWLLDPANKSAAIALLIERVKIPAPVAAKAYAAITDPVDGFAKDAKFDMPGFENVLKLRAEIEGQWGGHPPAPGKYVDLSYYDRAIASL